VVLYPFLREGDRIIPISVLSQSTLARFILSFISHFPTRVINPLDLRAIHTSLSSSSSTSYTPTSMFRRHSPPLAAYHLLALSTWLPPPSSTRFAPHSPLTTSLRSVLRLQTALPRPNLSNDETQSRSSNFRIW
jgi:hypothetical protein